MLLLLFRSIVIPLPAARTLRVAAEVYYSPGVPVEFDKDPDASLDYTVDWSLWLDTDYIVSATWTVPTGLTLVNQAIWGTPDKCTAWISGGTDGAVYTIANRISTALGRTDERSIALRVSQR